MQDEKAQDPAKVQHPVHPNLAGDPAARCELQVGLQTDVGPARKLNEDHLDYSMPDDEAQRQARGCLFVVADGMGGHQAGEVASHEAVARVMHEYYAAVGTQPGDSLVRAIKAANRVVYDYALTDRSRAGMGTTLVAAAVLGSKVYIANVGDSRAYVAGERGLVQITQDHSWVEEQLQAGLLSRDEAEKHPQRNLITRALGSKDSVDVDLFEGDLREGEALLLCTDGTYGPLTDEQMFQAVRSMAPPEAASYLVRQAGLQGGDDNSTALIVLRARPSPRSAADEATTEVTPSPEIALASFQDWLRARFVTQLGSRERRILVILAAALVVVCLLAALGLALGALTRPDPEATPEGNVQPPPTATLAPGPGADACCPMRPAGAVALAPRRQPGPRLLLRLQETDSVFPLAAGHRSGPPSNARHQGRDL